MLDGNLVQPLEISGVHGNRIDKLDVPFGNLAVETTLLRPSRYAEADKFYRFAATEFGNYLDSTALLDRISLWVCRDFAHLVVALLRAVNLPARVVSVYACDQPDQSSDHGGGDGDLPMDSIDQLVSIG